MVDQPNEPLILESGKGKLKIFLVVEELIQHFEYTIERASTDFYHIFFGNAVIHPIVRVTADAGFAIFAGKPDIKNGNEYVYKKVFLKGDLHYNSLVSGFRCPTASLPISLAL